MKKILVLILFAIQINSYCQEMNHEFVFNDTIQSKYLNESAIINIYLPPDYYNSKDNYPLQVVLGGYSRTRMYYSMNEYLSKTYQILDLNQLHTIPETIIVGLSTAPQNNFGKFEKFITNEVIPFVETKYRKTNSKTLIGHSSDGEFVLHNLFSNDSPFQNYFCTAPKNSGFFITQLKKQEVLIFLKESNRKLFFGASHQDYFYDENIELIKAFDEMDKGSFLFHSSIKTSDTHHTIFPNLLTDALLFIYKDWHFSIPESNPEKTTELYIEHYKVLSQKNLEEIVPPEFDFYLLAYILDSKQHTEEKIELLKKCKELYPKADNADAYLGRTYYMIGDLQNAERFNDNALLLNSNNGLAKQTKDLIEKKKE